VAPGSSGHLATTKLRVRFRGLAAHAAMAPQRGRNALLAAATAALNIHALPAYPGADTRVNVGRLEAGTASNVVAGEAVMLVESRAAVTEANEGLAAGIERVCLAAAQMYGADATIERTGEAPAFTCDPEAEALVAAAIPGTPNATEAPTFIDHASDDAGVLINRVRELGGVGTYSLIGGGPRSEVHHSAEFDIDERALVIAADLLERVVRTGAGRRRSAPTA
jgi:aminobenzoyl-glutamate utilization protein A